MSFARFISDVLLLGGVLLAIETALTVFWQEPVTTLLARTQAASLEDQLGALADSPQRPEGSVASAAATAREIKRLERRVEVGGALGRIKISRLGLRSPYVQGADLGSLAGAPGHYLNTRLPGEGGTIGIAGHRTTYGAPFRDIDRLRSGDEVDVDMPYGDFTYVVRRVKVVAPEAVEVLRSKRGQEQLVLTACHPPFSAAQRIIAFADRAAPVPEPPTASPDRANGLTSLNFMAPL